MPRSPTARPSPEGLRSLVVQAAFAAFVAIVVFVVGTGFFIIPRELSQQHRVTALEGQVRSLQAKVDAQVAKIAKLSARVPTATAPVRPTTVPAMAPKPAK